MNGYTKFWALRNLLEGFIVNTHNANAGVANSLAIDMANQAALHLTDMYRAYGIKFGTQNGVNYSLTVNPSAGSATGTQGFKYVRQRIIETNACVAALNNLPTQTNFATFSDPAGVEAYYETMWPALRAELEAVATSLGL